jgi:hypothetical protein
MYCFMVILSGNRKETVLEIKLLRNYKRIEELRFVSDRNYNYSCRRRFCQFREHRFISKVINKKTNQECYLIFRFIETSFLA